MSTQALLVTGAAGFIGSRVVQAANEQRIPVVCVDTLRPSDAFQTRPEHRCIDFGTTIDIEALELFLQSTESRSIGAVIHLGACTDTMNLDDAVHERLNVQFSKMLWAWSVERRIPFVYASSAATYGAEELCDDEEDQIARLCPLNPYGTSKHRFDLWVLERERTGEHPPTWSGFKFFNVYGYGERHKGRMASVVLHGLDQMRTSGTMTLFKSYRDAVPDGHQRRDFVYVDDVVRVLFFAVRGGVRRGIYNLGSGDARTFIEVADGLARALAISTRVRFIDMPIGLRPRYQYSTQARMVRLRQAGYREGFTSLEDGIERYLELLVAAGRP